MTTVELKEKYLAFFKKKEHQIISGASLIPENDPTALFISAGMHPLVPYLLGEKHPEGNRLVNVQKCIRTGDIEEVGDDFHLTFFEMLGNWSLGSYWKEEAIQLSFEFLTKELGLSIDNLSVTCFEGEPENKIPKDEESAKIWQELGIKEEKIKFLDRKENWWGPAGKTGPCGPDTEMFYNDVEIWNDVFMEYNKTVDGKYENLKQKNVDTGMGVERTVAILNNKKSVYEIEPLKSIIEKVQELVHEQDIRSARIITDHIRTAVFILATGTAPANLEQGYVLRRLIRRAIRFGKKIGIANSFIVKIAEVVIEKMKDEYSELEKNKSFIIKELNKEEEKFAKTIEKGLREFEKLSADGISGHDAFVLFSTYGFPLEMIKELAEERKIKIDEKEFDLELAKHQELSRTATAGRFKAGLADNSVKVTKFHTVAHLLLAALRQVLGEHVVQRGSNITDERIRLDFSHTEKMTPEQIKEVEKIVNEQIKKDLNVSCREMSLPEAKQEGAMGVFESKYGEKVKVYSIGEGKERFSHEICGGPHIKTTGELGHFKIKKEESSSAGVRRIKALLD